MPQNFKSFYFQDDRMDSVKGRPVTIAFSEDDRELFNLIKLISSEDFRILVGVNKLSVLEKKAEREGLPTSTYCLSLLRKKYKTKISTNRTFIEPLQATFRGGMNEPFQSWYPYLEGYSPEFVRIAIAKYAPNTKRILDPFAGSGTTPVTAMRMGINSLYCEVNPAMQFLIKAKLVALTLTAENRKTVVRRLRKFASTIEKDIRKTIPDLPLLEAFNSVFKGSEYFGQNEMDAILRTRTYIDNICCVEPIIAHFISVCVLSILIPTSNMIRRGDLRFMTKAERGETAIDFFAELCKMIEVVSKDVEQTEEAAVTSELICENACKIDNIPFIGVDTVITSPPYLNGTNYFRNTKMELWFLRCLQKTEDLASFRFKAITAGINDVTKQKDDRPSLPEIDDVYQELKQKAYDTRIPTMVSTYFNDIGKTFNGLIKHLSSNSKIVIDIGDSVYAGVHVPTDILITKILKLGKCHLIDRTVLRERISRGGAKLHQVLLVYEYRPQTQVMSERRELPTSWSTSWQKFKKELPHQKGEYAKRNWGNPLHSLCSYQGKMKPALASHLVKTFVSEGGRLLDPFSGVGTIPFEAALQGIKAFAFDISPTAYYISMAKIGVPEGKECRRIIDELKSYIQNSSSREAETSYADKLNFNGKISDYFHKDTLQEILRARKYFAAKPPKNPSQALVLSCLLHILHGNRPYALSRRSHPITPFAPTGLFEYRGLIGRLQDKVERSLECVYPDKFISGTIYDQDATSWWPQEVDNLDAIITSPPFFDSTRFYLANWMRLWFCGWEKEDFKTKPLAFVDERQKSSLTIYEEIMRQARERLKNGGVFVFHLGKSHKCDMGEELRRLAGKWFKSADLYTESVSHCESHGIRDKGAVTDHQYLVLN